MGRLKGNAGESQSSAAPGESSGNGGTIVWIASYPKSGNTWMRVFLTNLLRGGDAPVPIDDLREVGHTASRARFDEFAGIESSDLTDEEIERLRPEIHAAMAGASPAPLFIKIHDAPAGPRTGQLLVPPERTRGVLYLVRNPLDVAVSYAHHSGRSVDEIIDDMSDPGHTLSDASGSVRIQLTQHVGTWSDHVRSWTRAAGLDVHVVRYEEMSRDPLQTFAAAAAFSGLDADPEEIRRAVAFSRFDELRRQEEERGFPGGSLEADRFFRRGEVGAWRDELSAAQARRIVSDHGDVMRFLGYLDEAGEVVP